MIVTLTKNLDESRLYAFDFVNFPEVVGGDPLSSAPVFTVADGQLGLTVGAAAISGTQVQANVSGGFLGTTYLIRCTVVTAAGHTLESFGRLNVTMTS